LNGQPRPSHRIDQRRAADLQSAACDLPTRANSLSELVPGAYLTSPESPAWPPWDPCCATRRVRLFLRELPARARLSSFAPASLSDASDGQHQSENLGDPGRRRVRMSVVK